MQFYSCAGQQPRGGGSPETSLGSREAEPSEPSRTRRLCENAHDLVQLVGSYDRRARQRAAMCRPELFRIGGGWTPTFYASPRVSEPSWVGGRRQPSRWRPFLTAQQGRRAPCANAGPAARLTARRPLRPSTAPKRLWERGAQSRPAPKRIFFQEKYFQLRPPDVQACVWAAFAMAHVVPSPRSSRWGRAAKKAGPSDEVDAVDWIDPASAES
jgi:hypothetical protein